MMKVLSQPLQMTTVERATYANLIKMKDDIEKNEKLGHSFTLLDRAYWLLGPAKRTINDRLASRPTTTRETERRAFPRIC